MHACGAVFDNPDLLAIAVVGDGEAETGPLAGSWPGIDFLKASDVRVDFTQHSGDSPGVIAPVDSDTGVNVVGDDANREAVRRPNSLQPNAGAAVDSRPPASLGVQ